MKKTLIAAAAIAAALGLLYLCLPFVVEDMQSVRIGNAICAGIFT